MTWHSSSQKKRLAALRRHSLFVHCTTGELARVDGCSTEHRVAPGEAMTREGDAGDEFFVVLDGTASVSVGGRELAELGPGAFFGELALLDRKARSATVVARTDMRLLVLSRREFDTVRRCTPSISQQMVAEIGRRLRSADDLLVAADAARG